LFYDAAALDFQTATPTLNAKRKTPNTTNNDDKRHAYERAKPVYNYVVDECAPASLLIGDGGNVEGLYHVFVDTPPMPKYCADPKLAKRPLYQVIHALSFCLSLCLSLSLSLSLCLCQCVEG
jgi:hypothetical protein